MIGLENHEVERKVIAILKILSDSQEPLVRRQDFALIQLLENPS